MDAQRHLQHGKKYPDHIIERNKNDILWHILWHNISQLFTHNDSFVVKCLNVLTRFLGGEQAASSPQC